MSLPANIEREISAAAQIRNLQERVRRLETLEQDSCFQLIESQTGATFTTITVPANYRHLYIVYSAAALVNPPGDSIAIRFNGDTGMNYNWIRRLVTGSAELTTTDGAAPGFGGSTYALIGEEARSDSLPAAGFCLIPDYLSTEKWTTWVAENFRLSFSPLSYQLYKIGGRWIDKAAITSIDIVGTYFDTTMFSVYGLC